MRIVSLLPSATEIVCALGLEESLVGITHECDYPTSIIGKPVVTSSILSVPYGESQKESPDPDDEEPHSDGARITEPLRPISALEIDERVRAAVAAGESLYQIDLDRLRSLKPDILITQGLCDVCAVHHKMVVAAADALGDSVTVLDLAPTTLNEVLESFQQVGAATEREAQATELVERTRERWERVREIAKTAPERPKTLLLEWPEPPFSAGHWNPELLEMAGGAGADWDKTGVPSRTLTWDEIAAFGPETLVLMACGFDTYRALDEAYALLDAPGWFQLPAVREKDCFAVDGNAYFNRPGPRLAESAEILATILHPEIFTGMLPPFAAQIFSTDLYKRPRPIRDPQNSPDEGE